MKKLLTLMALSALALTASAEDHYLVGGCTPSGWTGGEWERSAVAMVNVAPYTWIWTGKLTVAEGDDGRFKIPDSAGGWDGYWAPEQDCLLTDEWTDLSTSGEGDFKYRVAEEGIYKVTLNTQEAHRAAEGRRLLPALDRPRLLLVGRLHHVGQPDLEGPSDGQPRLHGRRLLPPLLRPL